MFSFTFVCTLSTLLKHLFYKDALNLGVLDIIYYATRVLSPFPKISRAWFNVSYKKIQTYYSSCKAKHFKVEKKRTSECLRSVINVIYGSLNIVTQKWIQTAITLLYAVSSFFTSPIFPTTEICFVGPFRKNCSLIQDHMYFPRGEKKK